MSRWATSPRTFVATALRRVKVDGQMVRIGVTVAGADARQLVEFHLRQLPALAHLDRIEPHGRLTLNAGCLPFAIWTIQQEPAGRRGQYGRSFWVRSWCGRHWTKIRLPGSAATLLDALRRAGPAGIDAERRRALAAAGGGLSWSRRTSDLRGLGLPISVTVNRATRQSRTILHLGQENNRDDPPEGGLQVIPFSTVITRGMQASAELVERRLEERRNRHRAFAADGIKRLLGAKVAAAARRGMRLGARAAGAPA